MNKLQVFFTTAVLSTAVSTLGLGTDAQAIVFDFGNSGSNGGGASSLQFVESGLAVEATAATTLLGNDVQAANVTQRNRGLGVNSFVDPFEAVDNNNQIDGLGLLTGESLSLAFGISGDLDVVLTSATFARVDGNDEFTLLTDGNTFLENADIPDSGLFSFTSFQRADRTASVFTFSTTDQNDNYFLRAVEVEVVPEPFTVFGTLMAGAWGLQFRRRRNNKAS